VIQENCLRNLSRHPKIVIRASLSLVAGSFAARLLGHHTAIGGTLPWEKV
jgi:hypothetical protein